MMTESVIMEIAIIIFVEEYLTHCYPLSEQVCFSLLVESMLRKVADSDIHAETSSQTVEVLKLPRYSED